MAHGGVVINYIGEGVVKSFIHKGIIRSLCGEVVRIVVIRCPEVIKLALGDLGPLVANRISLGLAEDVVTLENVDQTTITWSQRDELVLVTKIC